MSKGDLPGPLLPVPLSLWWAPADPCLHRRPSNTSRYYELDPDRSLLDNWFPWLLKLPSSSTNHKLLEDNGWAYVTKKAMPAWLRAVLYEGTIWLRSVTGWIPRLFSRQTHKPRQTWLQMSKTARTPNQSCTLITKTAILDLHSSVRMHF